MTNSSFKGNRGAAVNPYAKKVVVNNPYAKKPTVNAKQPNNNATNNNKQSYNQLNRAAGNNVKVDKNVTSNAAMSRPYAKNTKAVTPTPKKKQIPHKHNKPGMSSLQKAATNNTGSSTARVVAPSHATPRAPSAPKKVVNRSTTSNAPIRKMMTPAITTAASRPQSLKQSLKSQIAQIKRRKQLLIQQKEEEKQRKQRQLELQKLQRQRQREAQKLLRQQQRQVVTDTIDHIITRVEQRIDLESKSGGVHYSIAEAMCTIIDNIERADREEKRLVREKKARLRKMAKERRVQVQQCLVDVVSGVERRVYGVDGVKRMQQYQQQQQQVQVQVQMQMQQQMQHHYNIQNVMPPPMYYTQQGVALPQYYPMQMPVTNNTVLGYPMHQPIPMQVPAMHYPHPKSLITHPQHPYVLPPKQTLVNSAPVTTAPKKPLVLSAHALNNPHSPYVSSHQLINGQLCVMKKEATDSFGVTLRHENKSVLVPLVESSTIAVATSGAAPTQATEKKPRRKRETFGVLSVVEASKARVVSLPQNERSALQPGDIILSINGRGVGGMTFAEACRFISTSSIRCSVTGDIRCVLTVARRKVPLPVGVVGGMMTGTNNNIRLPQSSPVVQAPTTVPLIPFSVFGERVVGDFSSAEWFAIVQAFPVVSRALMTGMALLPIAAKEVCTAIKENDAYRSILNRRSVESILAKIAFEGKRIDKEAKLQAEEYWKAEWESEVKQDADNDNNTLIESYLTDAQRSMLRSKARPTTGCKCGSKTHTFVSDPKCVLFRDVKQFCERNSIMVEDNVRKMKGKKMSTKGKGKLEAAYIRRFNQLREETAATKEEAEFVLKMEQNQSFGMKKAVFVPSSLCPMVLSAVAALMDIIPKDRLLDAPELDSKTEDKKDIATEKDVDEPKKPAVLDVDDSDDEDMPLTSLKRGATNSKLPSPKRTKQNETSNYKPKPKASAYIMGEILLHISRTYGHLFIEPSHPNYAWQQRHRSVITTPLAKEVMFAGNPRKPGTLSFEHVRFAITEERLARLKNNWLNHDQLKLSPQPTNEELRQLNDEWTITHLSSDSVTGIAHEIDVLEHLGILKINQSGSVVLAHGWEKLVPHMILNDMKDAWGSDMDVNNLHCIHDKITSSLENVWEHDEEGWRLESEGLDDDDLVYEDEEYDLRKQIFLENYDAFVNSRKGVGEFGI